MKKRIFTFFFLILLFSPYTSAYSPRITGIIHYRDGFLILTHYSNNTTQLWFFEPGKGFKLLNATFLNLTFIHSTGGRVLLYRNLSKGPFFQDFELYVYDGKLHFLGNYSETNNWGVGSEIYWNGKFYLFLEIDWSTQRGDYYNWYAIVGDEIYKVFPPSLDSSLYFLGVWQLPAGYLLEGEDPMSYQDELFLVALNGSRIVFENLTPVNLSVGRLCFNGTHFAALDSNWFKVIFYNGSVWRYYLQVISLSGNSRLIPLDSFAKDEGENVYFELLGSRDGVWVVRKYKHWCNGPGDGSLKCHEMTLGYFLVSQGCVEKIDNISNLTASCTRREPQAIFKWGRLVRNSLTLNSRRVVVNGTVISYGGRTFILPFNIIIGDCGNGCLLSNGMEIAYFDGNNVRLMRFPPSQVITRWLAVFGIIFSILIIKMIAEN